MSLKNRLIQTLLHYFWKILHFSNGVFRHICKLSITYTFKKILLRLQTQSFQKESDLQIFSNVLASAYNFCLELINLQSNLKQISTYSSLNAFRSYLAHPRFLFLIGSENLDTIFHLSFICDHYFLNSIVDKVSTLIVSTLFNFYFLFIFH